MEMELEILTKHFITYLGNKHHLYCTRLKRRSCRELALCLDLPLLCVLMQPLQSSASEGFTGTRGPAPRQKENSFIFDITSIICPNKALLTVALVKRVVNKSSLAFFWRGLAKPIRQSDSP